MKKYKSGIIIYFNRSGADKNLQLKVSLTTILNYNQLEA